MQRVHFIAIGGAAMHSIAIALSKKNNFEITGSDVEISAPVALRLKESKLLPEKNGWCPEKIHKGLNAVVINFQTPTDNPELLRARELGLKIYYYPDFLLHQTRSKTRIVVAGGSEKSTIATIILFVLKKIKIDTDYWLGMYSSAEVPQARLSYDSRIALFEADEFLKVAALPTKLKFYKPHIAILSEGIDVPSGKNATKEEYLSQFKTLAESMEMQGRLIYSSSEGDLGELCESLRRDLVTFSYNTPGHEIKDGCTYLKTRQGDVLLKISGEQFLRNLEAARLACRQIGVRDDQFYSAISELQL